MNDNIISILFLILAIFVSVTAHEFGHFIFAKIFKIRVKEFSIGIGPKIISIKPNETRYSIRLFPIVAYVMTDSNKLINSSLEIINDYVSDPKFNFEMSRLSWGEYVKQIFVSDEKGKYISNYFFYSSFRKYSELSENKNNKYFKLDDVKKWKVILVSLGGILVNLILFALSIIIWELILNQDSNFFDSIKSFFVNIWNVIIWNNERYGSTIYWSTYWSLFIALMMNVNLSLFLLNILPIPPLDGFKVASSIYESITKKTISSKFENAINTIGVVLVFYIMISSIIQSFIF